MLVIKELSPVYSQIVEGSYIKLKPCLSFNYETWEQGKYCKKRKVRKISLISKGGVFLTGFLKRVEDYCINNNVPFRIERRNYSFKSVRAPDVPNLQFKPFQLEAIKKAVASCRGVIVSPTGSGKTIMAIGIVSCFPESRVLFLVHTLDLLNQTYKKFSQFGFDDISLIGGGKFDIDNRIVIATRQSFSKIIELKEDLEFDIVIVDEVHHVSSFKGQYADILTAVTAPIRLGFTATLPQKEESLMAIEGLLGKVIYQVDWERAINSDIVVDVVVNLTKLPEDKLVRDLRSYREVYRKGVVERKSRHRAVLQRTLYHLEKGRTILILITEIEHGYNLQKFAKEIYDLDIEFVHGATPGDTRAEIQRLLDSREVKSVIASTIWNEGMDIPSLDVVVNASGGKSELPTLQKIGRGVRKAEGKDRLILEDFFDPSHPYLIDHFGRRLSLYFEKGWMGVKV